MEERNSGFSVETRTWIIPPSHTMELKSLMPEHSKVLLSYRCFALCSRLLGMALGNSTFGE